MSGTSEFVRWFQGALARPNGGVVGLVDDLLRHCPRPGLQLDWDADHCRIRSLAGGPGQVIERPLAKSVFRAVLARLAALCNEHRPDSVSPYGGAGKLAAGPSNDLVFQLSFANTAADAWLVLRPVRSRNRA